MDDKKNPYDDFFHTNRPDDGKGKKSDGANNETENQMEKPSYYYSYGPFKSSSGEELPRGERTDGETSPYAEQRQERLTSLSEVQISPPQQTRSFAPVTQSAAPNTGWQVREKRRGSFKAIFASFMAGVIVIGSLMAVADYKNWFTSSGVLATKQAEEAVPATGSEGGSSISTVSNILDSARPDNIAAIFEQASPAVVKIETFSQPRSSSGSQLDPFFRQFFGDNYVTPSPQNNGNQNEMVPSGLGSGFFFDDSGYILTNQHVVGDAAKVEVTVQGYAKPFDAEVLGTSYELDLAVLKVEGEKPFPTLKLGDSNTISIGDWVIAIGNPHGFDHTVTVGVLSSKERPISIPDEQGTRNYEHLLQTDASINPGNSGGPLLNTSGEVIGINTAISSSAQGIGFAIPTSTISEVLDSLKKNEKIPRPFIGASLFNLTEEFAKQLGMDEAKGVVVESVVYKSPAYNADLRQFDVIVGLNGKNYSTTEEIIAEIQKRKVGDKVTLNIVRNGKAMDLTVEIGDRNEFNQ